MRGILVIHSDRDFAREVHAREGRALWSAAIGVVLEKHGLLETDFAGPEAISDPAVFSGHACVLVCRLPAGSWTAELVDRALAAPGLVIVEAPIPEPIRAALGITETVAGSAEGTVVCASSTLREDAVEALGAEPGGAVSVPESRRQDLAPERQWAEIPGIPIGAATAKAWRRRGWEAEAWPHAGGEVLAGWGGQEGETAGVVRRDGLVACCWGIFTHLAQQHTSEPTIGEEFRASPRVLGLEALLLALVRDAHRRAEIDQLRVLPWPAPFEWALGVRHDVDRPLDEHEAIELLGRHAASGSAATWYWLAWHLPAAAGRPSVPMPTPGGGEDRSRDSTAAAIRRIAAAPRQEVALHTALPWTEGESEMRLVEASSERRVSGSSAHGSRDCFRYQGAPNVLWAADRELAYTELVQHSHHHPHRYAALRADGSVEVLERLICLPRHESFERSTTPGDLIDRDELLGRAERLRRAGGFLQILNHPDLNIPELFAAIDSLPAAGRLDWSAERVADWWLRTHSRDNLRLGRRGGDLTIDVQHDVEGVALELRRTDGGRETFEIDASPGRTTEIPGVLGSPSPRHRG